MLIFCDFSQVYVFTTNHHLKKFVKFQGDMLIFCDFIQVYVFTTNHHLKVVICGKYINLNKITEI